MNFWSKIDKVIMDMYSRTYFFLKLTRKMIIRPSKTIALVERIPDFRYALYFLTNLILITMGSLISVKAEKETGEFKIKLPFLEGVNSDQFLVFISYFIGIILFSVLLAWRLRKFRSIITYEKTYKILFISSALFIPMFIANKIISYMLQFVGLSMGMGGGENFGIHLSLIMFGILAVQILGKNIWYGYFLYSCFGKKPKILLREIYLILLFILSINFIFSVAPFVPKLYSFYTTVEEIEDYEEVKEAFNSKVDINNLYQLYEKGTKIMMSQNLPNKFREKIALQTTGYWMLIKDIEESDINETSAKILLALKTDDYEEIKNIVNLRKVDGEDIYLLSGTQAILDLYKNEKEEEGVISNEKKLMFSFNEKAGIWGKLINLFP